jgi:S1-C subfamily serine protease
MSPLRPKLNRNIGSYARFLAFAPALLLFLQGTASAQPQSEPPPPVPLAAPVPSQPAAPLPSQPVLAEANQPAQKPDASSQWLKAVYERVADAVVLIDTDTGTGSGFFFHSKRHVATALHVVDDAELIIVRTSDGRRVPGDVVAYSRDHDLALVELAEEMANAHVLEPDLGHVDIGERVAVIGHPFSGLERSMPELRGLLNWSLTQGVVGAVAGSWLQTDAAINPGNSGGPVLNADGQVLGVVSAKLNEAQGIGLIARVGRLQELVPRIGSQGPPRKLVTFGGLELAFVVHWMDESIDGFSVGTGVIVRKRFPVQLRLGFMGGEVEPDAPTILSTRLERFSAELTTGINVPLGDWSTLSPYLGAALFYDRKHDASLRIDSDIACPNPPCLVEGRVLRSLEKQLKLLPLAGVSLDIARLRISYAYQLYFADLDESQHRILAGIVF